MVGDGRKEQVRLEVLQLLLRQKILAFVGARCRSRQEIEEEFGFRDNRADYHLAMLEKAPVIERKGCGYSAMPTGVLFLKKVGKGANI
jgi:predicted transcriptional regulator